MYLIHSRVSAQWTHSEWAAVCINIVKHDTVRQLYDNRPYQQTTARLISELLHINYTTSTKFI